MKKKYLGKNTLACIIFFFSVVAILIILVLSYFKCGITVKDSFKKEDIYNLLTINTIFSGFLYTMLGNLVEFNSRKEIKKKDIAGYVDKYYSPIYFGLTYFILAIVIEICILYFDFRFLIGYLILLQKLLSIFGIIFFVASTIMLRKMINNIRNK